jgi:hypothetical protein
MPSMLSQSVLANYTVKISWMLLQSLLVNSTEET